MLGEGVRAGPDIGSVASLDGRTLSILVWHYHDDDVAGAEAEVTLKLAGLPATLARGATLAHYRIDAAHSNAFAAWRAMGAPIAPSNAQRAALLKAAELATVEAPPEPIRAGKAGATLRFRLPRQGVSLLVLRPAATQALQPR